MYKYYIPQNSKIVPRTYLLIFIQQYYIIHSYFRDGFILFAHKNYKIKTMISA